GYLKWLYREFPVSFKEADLEHNVLAILETVLLNAICFIDIYHKGLDGKQAA
ncbi:hypothetical protein BDR05DRAFT_892301, partial [Suillus weaverae]